MDGKENIFVLWNKWKIGGKRSITEKNEEETIRKDDIELTIVLSGTVALTEHPIEVKGIHKCTTAKLKTWPSLIYLKIFFSFFDCMITFLFRGVFPFVVYTILFPVFFPVIYVQPLRIKEWNCQLWIDPV